MKLPLLSKNIVSIDIGSYEIKIVEGKKVNNSIKIKKNFSLKTPEGSYDDGHIKDDRALYEVLRNGLKENKVSTKTAFLSIKSTDIITREIPFPAVSIKDIDGMLQYQLEEYLPMDISRYVIQYKIIGSYFVENQEKLKVLVVAAPKEIVEKHYFLLNELDLKPEVLDYQSNSISKLMDFAEIINENLLVYDKTVAFVDLGHSNTNVLVVKNGKLQTSRPFKLSGKGLHNDIQNILSIQKNDVEEKLRSIGDIFITKEDYSDSSRLENIIRRSLDNIIMEIDNIIKYYISKEIENEINLIVLTGGLSNFQGVDKLFEDYYNIETVVLKDVNRVNIQNSTNKYISCIGALLRQEEV